MAALVRRLDPLQVPLLRPGAHPKPVLVPPPLPVEPGQRPEVQELRASLDPGVGAKIINGAELVRAIARRRRDTILPTTIEPPDAAWVRLARVAESHGCTMLVSAPYALTGTTSEAMVATFASRARWFGSARGPRVLAGIETRLRLEKHRHKKTGESAKVFFEVV